MSSAPSPAPAPGSTPVTAPNGGRPTDQAGHPHQPVGLPPEQEVWSGRASVRSFFPSWVLWAVVLIVVHVMLHKYQLGGHGWATLGMLAVLLVIVVRQLLELWAVSYRLTTQRLFVRRGILNTTTDQTELVRVDDVRVIQRLLPRLLGLGDVELLSNDFSDKRLVIGDVPDPNVLAEHVRTNVRTMRQVQRMVYMENVGQAAGGDSPLPPPVG